MTDTPGRKAVNAHTTPFLEYDLEGPRAARHELAAGELRPRDAARQRSHAGGRGEAHDHPGMEEFLIVDGALVDSDGSVFGPGDFVSYEAGTHHNSRTERGCPLAVFEWRRPE